MTTDPRLTAVAALQDAARALLALDPDALALVIPDRLHARADDLTHLVADAAERGKAHGFETPDRVVLVADVVHTTEGTTMTPWTNGWAVGHRITRDDDAADVEFAYLNPSVGSENSEDAGTATTFLYAGPVGEPSEDDALTHLVLLHVRPVHQLRS